MAARRYAPPFDARLRHRPRSRGHANGGRDGMCDVSLPSSQRWDLPEGQVRVRRAGRPGAPGVVLIHGLGGSSLNWVDLMDRLSDDAELMAVDLPGFGMSPPPRDGDYSPKGHARAVAALIRSWQGARGTDAPLHVFGNSLGGAVSLHLAASEPARVASLTLISPALPDRRVGRGNAHLPIVAVPGLGEALIHRYSAVSAEQRVQATLDACFVDPGVIRPEVRQALIDEVAQRDGLPFARDAFLSSLRGLLAGFVDPSRDRPWGLARRTRQPVLAVYGDSDVLIHPRSAAIAARHFADAEVVLLSECGHAAQMEHADLVAELWRRRVLARQAPQPARAP